MRRGAHVISWWKKTRTKRSMCGSCPKKRRCVACVLEDPLHRSFSSEVDLTSFQAGVGRCSLPAARFEDMSRHSRTKFSDAQKKYYVCTQHSSCNVKFLTLIQIEGRRHSSDAGCTKIGFFKIDVQGHELRVLKGALRALQTRPSLAVFRMCIRVWL